MKLLDPFALGQVLEEQMNSMSDEVISYETIAQRVDEKVSEQKLQKEQSHWPFDTKIAKAVIKEQPRTVISQEVGDSVNQSLFKMQTIPSSSSYSGSQTFQNSKASSIETSRPSFWRKASQIAAIGIASIGLYFASAPQTSHFSENRNTETFLEEKIEEPPEIQTSSLTYDSNTFLQFQGNNLLQKLRGVGETINVEEIPVYAANNHLDEGNTKAVLKPIETTKVERFRSRDERLQIANSYIDQIVPVYNHFFTKYSANGSLVLDVPLKSSQEYTSDQLRIIGQNISRGFTHVFPEMSEQSRRIQTQDDLNVKDVSQALNIEPYKVSALYTISQNMQNNFTNGLRGVR